MAMTAADLAALPPERRAKIIGALTDEERGVLTHCWEDFWARPKQIAPIGDWLIWLLLAGRGFGKMLALDTPIPTPDGWKTIGDIEIGDAVFDEAGRPCRVTATFDGVAQVAYRLRFSDGTHVDACSEHQWVTWSSAERKAFLRSPYEETSRFPEEWPAWRLAAETLLVRQPVVHADAPGPAIRTTQDIVDTLRRGPRGDLNHAIPVCGALQLPERQLPIDPYVLGAWLGDGTAADGTFTAHQEDQPHLRAAIERAGYRHTVHSDPQRVGTVGLYRDLRLNGLLGDKHVPEVYLRASAEQRLALLRGLMDTDGTASTSGCVEFPNTNRALVDAVVELARGLGQKPVVSEGRATLDGVDHGPFWRAHWTPTVQIFSLPRKVERVFSRSTAQSLRNHHRMIVDAQRIEPARMRCLTVDSHNAMFLAGAGMIPTHNTRTGAQWVHRRAMQKRRHIILAGATSGDIRDTMIEGDESGLLAIAPPDERPIFNPSKARITWPNGSWARLISADKPDKFRGPNADTFWADELAAWRYSEAAWHQLMLCVRIGNDLRGVVTTTPRATPLIKRLAKQRTVRLVHGSSHENRANLADAWFEEVIKPLEGTRMGRQEIDAVILEDAPGALWKRKQLDDDRVEEGPVERTRVGVAIDHAVSTGASGRMSVKAVEEGSDRKPNSTAIVAGYLGPDPKGKDKRLHGFVTDCRVGIWSPEEWARKAFMVLEENGADFFVVERNQGGDLVAANLRTIDRNVKIVEVNATRGKWTRAEPIASLDEQHRIHHVGSFPELEDELCQWEPDLGLPSPDRLDARVWLFTHLMIDKNPAKPTGGGRSGRREEFEDKPFGYG